MFRIPFTGLSIAAVLLVACTAPASTPTLIPTSVPTPSPTPTVTPTPRACPAEYERELRRHPSLTNEEARSYRPSLHEPGVTVHQILCDGIRGGLGNLAWNYWISDEEAGAAEALGMELAQLHPKITDVSRAFYRWYTALPDYWYPKREWGSASRIRVEFSDSYHGEPATVLIVEGKEGLSSLAGLLQRRYREARMDILPGAGEVIVCRQDKDRIFRAMSSSAAARGLGIDDPWEEHLFCKPGVF